MIKSKSVQATICYCRNVNHNNYLRERSPRASSRTEETLRIAKSRAPRGTRRNPSTAFRLKSCRSGGYSDYCLSPCPYGSGYSSSQKASEGQFTQATEMKIVRSILRAHGNQKKACRGQALVRKRHSSSTGWTAVSERPGSTDPAPVPPFPLSVLGQHRPGAGARSRAR
jgi:hypothetical protein